MHDEALFAEWWCADLTEEEFAALPFDMRTPTFHGAPISRTSKGARLDIESARAGWRAAMRIAAAKKEQENE